MVRVSCGFRPELDAQGGDGTFLSRSLDILALWLFGFLLFLLLGGFVLLRLVNLFLDIDNRSALSTQAATQHGKDRFLGSVFSRIFLLFGLCSFRSFFLLGGLFGSRGGFG